MRITIVAFRGTIGSGKDAAAKYIKDHCGGVRCLAFADPLKQLCMKEYDLTKAQVYDTTEKEIIDPRYGICPREILQLVGAAMIGIDPLFLIKRMRNRVKSTRARIILITDCRFDREARFVQQELCGTVILLDRPGPPRSIHNEHATEKAITTNYVNMTIENNGTLEEFQDKIYNNVIIPLLPKQEENEIVEPEQVSEGKENKMDVVIDVTQQESTEVEVQTEVQVEVQVESTNHELVRSIL